MVQDPEAPVHIMDHGAMAEPAGAGRGAAPLVAEEAADFTVETSVEDSEEEPEVASAAAAWAVLEVMLEAWQEEVLTAEALEAHSQAAQLALVQAHSG